MKTKQRVKDFGEVYTPERLVKDMCDIIPKEVRTTESTYLEPTCGNGNFLAEILQRKLDMCESEHDIIIAVNSIYGVDILQDNIRETRERLLKLVIAKTKNIDTIIDSKIIMENNIVQGDMLKGLPESFTKEYTLYTEEKTRK